LNKKTLFLLLAPLIIVLFGLLILKLKSLSSLMRGALVSLLVLAILGMIAGNMCLP
jgi:hypothetical protein